MFELRPCLALKDMFGKGSVLNIDIVVGGVTGFGCCGKLQVK